MLEGRAHLRLPAVSKLLLAHWAGAPWSDKDEDANLHALQAEVIFHREREKIVHGASRLGKSVLGGCDLINAMILPQRKVAVVAARYDHVAHEFQYLVAGLKKLFGKAPQAMTRLVFRHQMQYHDYDAQTIWGARCIGISTQSDDGAQLLGRELTDVVIGEGSHIPVHIFNQRLLRALDGATMKRKFGAHPEIGSLSIYTTPKGFEGCSAHEWERVKKLTKNQPHLLNYGNVPWARSVWVREASILENPAYDRAVYDARKETLDKVAFAEQYQGKMTYASGRVWRSFREDDHVVVMPPPEYIQKCRLGLGIDTGACTALILVGIGPDGKKWAFGESYLEKPPGGIYANLSDAEEMLMRVLGPVFNPPTLDWVLNELLFLCSIDPASQHKLEIVDRWECALSSPNTSDQRSLQSTLDTVESWFKNDELYIVDDCIHLIDQIRKYVWKTYKAPRGVGVAPVVREPQKGYDHCCDALRFGLIPLAEYGPLTEPAPTTSFVDAWEEAQRESLFGPLRRALARGAEREEMYRRWHR